MLAAISCAKEMAPAEELTPGSKHFTCSMPETKTAYDGAKGASWVVGDMVKVFDAQGVSDTYTITTPGVTFEFNANVGDGPYYSVAGPKAVVEAATFDVSSQSVTFPMGSEFDGSFANADVLVSTSDETSLFYKHALGIFEFEVSNPHKVEFAASGACAASVAVAFDQQGTAILSVNEASDKISVDAKAAGTYYFPVVPQTFANGFKFTADADTEKAYVKEYSSSFTVAAGDVAAAGKVNNPYELNSDGRATIKISDEGFLEVYYANKQNSKCVILYPGGGYSNHSAGGIESVKTAFAGTDVTLIVDYFTLPSKAAKRDQSIADAEKAIDLAWENKDIWGGYTSVGLIGNSAGGHLAGYMAQTRHEDVDFQILIYPVVTLEEGKTHEGTRLNWLGTDPSQELTDLYSNEKHVSLDTPPTYLSYSTGDGTVPQAFNGKVMGEALKAIDHKYYEEHVYNDSSHSVNTWPDWPQALYDWLARYDQPVEHEDPSANNIATAEQFKEFLANAATAQATDTYTITEDIDLAGDYTAAASFAGTLDGQNHKISGIDKNIFESLAGTVQNLTLEGAVSITSGPGAYGILANTANSATISSVTNRVNLTVNGGALTIADMGALVGQATGSTLVDVHNYGTVTVNATSYAATNASTLGGVGFGGYTGIVGSTKNTVLNNCANHAEIKVTVDGVASSLYFTVAGVVATTTGGSFTNCDNAGPVTLNVKTSSVQQHVIVGGVLGFNNSSAVMKNCDNTAAVTFDAPSFPAKHFWLAGVAASTSGSVSNSTNSGKITVKAAANANNVSIGGIAGQLAGASTMSDCANTGAIEFNVGTSSNTYVGGAVGNVAGAATIDKCSNNAPITFVGTKTGALRVGGVVGTTPSSGAITKNLTNGADGDISLTCATVANCYSGGCVHGCWSGNTNGNYSNAGDITVNITNHTGNFLLGGCAGFAINSGTVVTGTLVNTGKITVTLGTLGNTSSSAVGGAMAARWSAASVTATINDTGVVSCNLGTIPAANGIAKVI